MAQALGAGVILPVWLIAGLVCGIIPMILLLLLCLYRPSKDSCCIRQSERTNQGSDINYVDKHNGAQGGLYSTLLHGDAGLYESIKGPMDSEHATPGRMHHFTKGKLKSEGNSGQRGTMFAKNSSLSGRSCNTWSYRQNEAVFSCESESREFSNITIEGADSGTSSNVEAILG